MSQASAAARTRIREVSNLPPLPVVPPYKTNRPVYAVAQLNAQALSPRYPLLETEAALEDVL